MQSYLFKKTFPLETVGISDCLTAF